MAVRGSGGWRSFVFARVTIGLGALLALGVMELVWALAVEPASCDTSRLPDGSLVYPSCMAPMPPDVLRAAVTIAGALIGYAIYRLARNRSTDEEIRA